MSMNSKLLYLLLILCMPICALAEYDPDHFDSKNAAYWYRKAFLQMENIDIMRFPDVIAYRAGLKEPDEEILKFDHNLKIHSEIRKYIKQEISLTKETEDFIKSQNEITTTFIKASKCDFCSWDHEDINSIPKSKFKQYLDENNMLHDGLLILLGNTILSAEKKDFNASIQSYLASFKVTEHYQLHLSGPTDGYNPIDYGDFIDCSQNLLFHMANNEPHLRRINEQLKLFLQNRLSRQEIFDNYTIDYAIMIGSENKENLKKIHDANDTEIVLEGTFDIEKYYEFRKKLKDVWLLHFEEAYLKVQEIKDFLPKPYIRNGKYININSYNISRYERFIPSDFWAGYICRAQQNAVYIASTILIRHAKTDQLPKKLPSEMPNDPFSNKPFIYEITESGFKLQCQGKVFDNLKYPEYEFKLSK